MEIATRFKELRLKAGLTQTALAKPTYTVSYVSQIEAGRRVPSPKALDFFSRQLGVTPEFLATGVPEGIDTGLRYEMEEASRALREERPEDAEQRARTVLAEAGRYELTRFLGPARAALGNALIMSGEVRQAIDAFEEALEWPIPERERGLTVAALARAYRTVGDLAYAVDLVESFLTEREGRPQDPAVLAELQTVLVSVYFERGDVFRAERAAGRALAAANETTSVQVQAKTYWDASRVMAEARQWDEALDYATRARVLMEQLDDKRRVARLHNAYAFLCLEAEPPRLEDARQNLDKAELLLLEASAPGDLSYVLSERARLALLESQPKEAVFQAESALSVVGDDELEAARCLYLKGRGLAALFRGDEAKDALEEAASKFAKHGARQQEASCWRELGEIELEAGHTEAAVEALRAGLRALDPRRSRA